MQSTNQHKHNTTEHDDPLHSYSYILPIVPQIILLYNFHLKKKPVFILQSQSTTNNVLFIIN